MLKKVFTLPDNHTNTNDLRELAMKIQFEFMLMDKAKQDIVKLLTVRNKLIGDILLKDYNYPVSQFDKIIFDEQTNRIYIKASGPDFLENESTLPT